MSYKGSEWRKWDLHIHTPQTKLNDGYKANGKFEEEILDLFIKKLEKSDVQVFGITDYFSIDNFIKVKKRYSELYAESKKVLFPNIELRLEVQVNKQTEEVHLHLLFDTNQEKNIEEFLKLLKLTSTKPNGTHYKATQSDLESIGFEAASTNLTFMKKALTEIFGTDKPYFKIGVCSGAGSARADSKSQRKMVISDEIDKFCDIMFGKVNNQAYFLDENRYELDELAKPKPVISCSDCHSFQDIDNYLGKQVIDKNKIIKDVTWIKADTTFEGIKQIIYEPKSRLIIQKDKPIEPIHKITNLTIKLPKNVNISNNINGKIQDEEFCLAGKEYKIKLNPYFNCFVGGRGTGKSSILNLIHESLTPNKNVFFQDHPLRINNTNIRYSDYIQVNDNNPIEIEYLSQNEIEEYAIKANLFTKAIFERITKRDTEKVLENKFSFIKKYRKELVSISDLYKRKRVLEESLKSITHELSINNSIISSYKDEEYKKYILEIKQYEKELQYLQDSKNRLFKYKQIVIDTLPSAYIPASTRAERSVYDNILFDFSKAIEKLINDIENVDFTKEEKQEKELAEKLRIKKVKFEEFLAKRGLSLENFKDISSANQKIVVNSNRKNSLEKELGEISLFLDRFSYTNLYYGNYESAILSEISKINEILKGISKQGSIVKAISIEYNFDITKMNEVFLQYLKDDFEMKNIGTADLSKYVKLDDPNFFADKQKCLEIINKQIESKPYETKTATILKDIIDTKFNFEIIKTQYELFKLDINRFMKINVYYDNRLLQNSSFGQRCTATIVILLCLGNKPLIIDEPEAHLDSALIAEYLVKLIKKEKTQRQLIIATHNANFVINGDSELIHILEIDRHNKTLLTPTSIECLENRKKLLKLEGGKEAFKQRQEKYHF